MTVVVENRSNKEFNLGAIVKPFIAFTPDLGIIIDTQRYTKGLTFVVAGTLLTATNVVSFEVLEDDDPTMSSATVVSDENLTAPVSELNINDEGQSEGDLANAISMISTKRYVRLRINTTLGNPTGIVFATAIGVKQVLPVAKTPT